MATEPRTKTIGRGWRKRDSLTLRYGNEGLTPSTCRRGEEAGPCQQRFRSLEQALFLQATLLP